METTFKYKQGDEIFCVDESLLPNELKILKYKVISTKEVDNGSVTGADGVEQKVITYLYELEDSETKEILVQNDLYVHIRFGKSINETLKSIQKELDNALNFHKEQMKEIRKLYRLTNKLL